MFACCLLVGWCCLVLVDCCLLFGDRCCMLFGDCCLGGVLSVRCLQLVVLCLVSFVVSRYVFVVG